MKYFVISDIHGQYDLMIDALTKAGFNEKTDTLITAGDLFDRGLKSAEILKYVMGLENYFPIWGNHDARLKELVNGADFQYYDITNGVPATLDSFIGMGSHPSIGFQLLKDKCNENARLLNEYFDRCCWAIEFKDYVITHAWLPLDVDTWRNASKKEWYEASWTNTARAIDMNSGKFIGWSKQIIVGHWHSFRIRVRYDDNYRGRSIDYNHLNCDTFILENIHFIDGCANAPECGGKVNVFTFESNETPMLHQISLYRQ